MSMWLSAANRVAGLARSQVAADTKRQINHTLAQSTEDNLKLWFGAPMASRPKAKAKAKTPKR